MPLSGHGRAGCCPVFTGCRYSLIQDRIVCKTNYDMKAINDIWAVFVYRIVAFATILHLCYLRFVFCGKQIGSGGARHQ